MSKEVEALEFGPVVIIKGPNKGPAYYFENADKGPQILCYLPPRTHITTIEALALTETPVVVERVNVVMSPVAPFKD